MNRHGHHWSQNIHHGLELASLLSPFLGFQLGLQVTAWLAKRLQIALCITAALSFRDNVVTNAGFRAMQRDNRDDSLP
ncbi:hypothetical protein MWU49_09155 [Alcanivorax sp. S6407]|uniref:hypothetical protein n=1 Tax=Alcanivorax sp. S6407 TaxID=2926424 RepID=UPI001FF67103|nr:hypothetical protein [Alcanivorax sp. S6407]MCK0153870.1 hypothetical protein [Alcanivorax sp. S6407]